MPWSCNSYRVVMNNLSVFTFNILELCYIHLLWEYNWKGSYESIWQSYHLSIMNLLQFLEIYLICLEEFLLIDHSFVDLYKSYLPSKYFFIMFNELMISMIIFNILIDKNHWKVFDRYNLLLDDIENHIGLLLNLQFNEKCLLLINIHLTFPHNSFNDRWRLMQIKKFLFFNLWISIKNKCLIIIVAKIWMIHVIMMIFINY